MHTLISIVATAAAAFAVLASSPAMAGVADAVADPTRLAEHRDRDAARKPAAVLSLTDVKAGDAVADLAAGSGYYTAILSRIVGEQGTVHAVDPVRIFEAFPNASKTFPAYQEKDPRENISYSVQRFDELAFDQPLDLVVMGLYYHDTLWTGVDRAAMNTAIFNALKPGGAFLVIDHIGLANAKEDITKTQHRMVPGTAKPEILSAGFVLEAESDALSNPEDSRDSSVFDAAIRGKTDRFVYPFRKP